VGIDPGRRRPKEKSRAVSAAEERADGTTARSGEAPGDPEAYALLFSEAVRALSAQEASLDELRVRAATMLSAAGVISAFLGTAALTVASSLSTKGPNPTPWCSVALIYAGILAAIVVMIVSSALFVSLLPARSWIFRVGTHELLRDYIEAKPAATMPEIHRSLAWYLADGETKNAKALGGLYSRFSWAAGLFVADLVSWLVVLSAVVIVRLQA
jgi:hypothetical protein